MQPDPSARNDLRPVTVAMPGRGSLSFVVDGSGRGPACFSLGVRKSGSTMLHRIARFMGRCAGVNTVDIAGGFFNAGFTVPDWASADLSEVVRPGNLYLGFRTFPANIARQAVFQGGRKIFMFRDPRDALVSQYFSDAYSHSLPSDETEAGRQAAEAFLRKRAETLATDIETYVLKQAPALAGTLMAFRPMLDDPNCLLLRYEEFIFQKKRLIHKVLRHFGWECAPGQVEALLHQIDLVPEAEEQQRFVRRVIPGDHRNKLSQETIRRLDNRMREVLELYDYH